MHYPKKLLLFLGLLSALLSLSCQKTVPESVQISFGTPIVSSELKLFRTHMLNYGEMVLERAEGNLEDSTSFKFALNKSTFATISINETSFPVFLEPGYDLRLELNDNKIRYSGQGAKVNNYLAMTNTLVEQFFQSNGEFWRLDLSSFEQLASNLQAELTQFHQAYTDTTSLSLPLQDLLQSRNELISLDLSQQYLVINQFVGARRDSLPESIKQTIASVPLEAQYLDLHLPVYARVLDLYLRGEMQSFPIEEDEPEKVDALQATFPRLSHELIRKKDLDPALQDYFWAKNIDHWLGLQSLSPTIDSLYQEYKRAYPNSPYGDELALYYQDWQRLLAGRPAPEVVGLDLHGDTVKLSDLKGKLVYMDVWASWCRPCLAEFPYYESLQAEFREEEAIEFLFVSIDQDRGDWEKAVRSKAPSRGLHINDLKKSEDYAGIISIYNMWGISQRLIIDQAGNIVDTKAPPPSLAKTKEILKSLL